MLVYDQSAAQKEPSVTYKVWHIHAYQQDQTEYFLPIPEKNKHALVRSTECFLANFSLYKDLFYSAAFLLNTAERTAMTSRLLLEAFCKQSGKAEIRKCPVKLQEVIISKVQVLFYSSTHWEEITREMEILHSQLSWAGLSSQTSASPDN